MTNLDAWKEETTAEDIAALHQTSWTGCRVCPARKSGFCTNQPETVCENIFIEWANMPIE